MELVPVLLLWLVCAVACYLIAERKHDPNPMVWTLAGLLLGPLGLVATWFFSSPRKA